MDGGAWWAAVHGVARSQTQLSDFTFTFHFHALETQHSSCTLQPACCPKVMERSADLLLLLLLLLLSRFSRVRLCATP